MQLFLEFDYSFEKPTIIVDVLRQQIVNINSNRPTVMGA
jgi:hypothetical protein